jgi:hypothetical protein
MTRAALALAALCALPAMAPAGPINWSYSSSGTGNGLYSLDPGGMPVTTPLGVPHNFYLIGGWTTQLVQGTPPAFGPTFLDWVTITDSDSGKSGTFTVPIAFTDLEPSNVHGWLQFNPVVGPIKPIDLVLGKHQFIVTNSTDNHALSVQINATPEPTSLALAGFGLVGFVLGRLRRSRSRS